MNILSKNLSWRNFAKARARKPKPSWRWVVSVGIAIIVTVLAVHAEAQKQRVSIDPVAIEDNTTVDFVPPAVFQAAGPNIASIQGTITDFRAALGDPVNGNALTELGFRSP